MRAALICLLSCCALRLTALAGGGGGYSGGGGGGFGGGGGYSGGGYSGGGSGDGFPLFELIALLLFKYPVVGVPLLIGAGVFGWFWLKWQREHRTAQTIRGGHRRHSRQADSMIAGRLSNSDPAFDRGRLERRVRDAFRVAQEAWCAHDLPRVACFCSDGIIERWSIQLDEQRAHGYRDRVEDLHIDEVVLVDLQEDRQFQVLTIAISGRAVDYRVDPQGAHLHGSKAPQRFREYWSFLRRAGSASLGAKRGLIEGNCPNCGAPITVNQHTRCQHCQAHLKSGSHDWVLAEITQPSEWQPREAGRIPGLISYRQQDPGCNAQQLEDLASVVFYRHQGCERLGRSDLLAGVATEQFRKGVDEEIRGAGVRQQYLAEFAIGGVACLGLRRGEQVDEALVEVRWSGVTWTREADGRVRRGQPTPPRRHAYLLWRQAGAQTDLDETVTSAHCPSCGAPADQGSGAACTYCGADRGNGQHWQVAACLSWADPQLQQLLNAMRQQDLPSGARPQAAGQGVAQAGAGAAAAAAYEPVIEESDRGGAVLAWAIHVAQADGVISPQEKRALQGLAGKLGAHPGMVDGLLANPQEQPPQPQDEAQARRWLELLADVAWSDGTVDLSERSAMRQVGQAIGMHPYEVNRLIRLAKQRAVKRAQAL